MMKTSVKILFGIIVFLFNGIGAFAQQAEMADTMRSEGKIYVVVLMIIIVLGGMITYLFLLDKKLNRMEKELHQKRKTFTK